MFLFKDYILCFVLGVAVQLLFFRINSDFKLYTSEEFRFGIGQVEVQSLSELATVAPKFLEALERVRTTQGLDGTMLLISDVLTGDRILLHRGLDEMFTIMQYEQLFSGVLNLPGILSRKKQLVPDVLKGIG